MRTRAAWVGAAGVLAGLALAAGCESRSNSGVTPPADPPPAEAVGPPLFEDVTAATGIDFTYRNGEDRASTQTPGHPRVARRRGGPDRLRRGRAARRVPPRRRALRRGRTRRRSSASPCRLYRNLGGCKFEDVTARGRAGQTRRRQAVVLHPRGGRRRLRPRRLAGPAGDRLGRPSPCSTTARTAEGRAASSWT